MNNMYNIVSDNRSFLSYINALYKEFPRPRLDTYQQCAILGVYFDNLDRKIL